MKTAMRIVRYLAVYYILMSMVLSAMVFFDFCRWNAISCRVPFTIVDVALSEVEGEDYPNHKYGFDQRGDYIGFRSDVNIGDRVLSLMVFNPLSYEVDDIIGRFDVNL